MKVKLKSLSATPILYHKTHIGTAVEILSSGYFRLSPADATQADKNINLGYKFYMSTGRSPSAKYNKIHDGTSSVQLVLDGRVLNARAKVKAVDYWGEDYRKFGGGEYEQEDRVLSDKDKLPIKNVIKEIHTQYSKHPASKLSLRQLAVLCKKQNIKLFVHDSGKDLRLLNRRKAKPLTSFDLKREKKDLGNYFPDYSVGRKNIGHAISELIHKPIKHRDKLSDKAQSVLSYIRYQEFERQVSGDLHNAKSRTSDKDKRILQIFDDMKKIGVKDLKELGTWLQDKWF